MARTLVATHEGLHVLDETATPGALLFEGRAVTGLAPASGELWAVLDRSELWHQKGGELRHVTDLASGVTCLASVDGELLVGSSEASLYRLTADALQPVASFEEVDGRAAWYTPWGGPPDTRSIANWDDDVYVNVHVGGIPHSADGGKTWAPTIDVDADVHQVTTAEGLVLAACAGGLAVSPDRGRTWSMRTEGLDARYARAVVVCGDTVLVSTSRGPRGGDAAVFRAGLRGGPFARCAAGPGTFGGNVDTFWLDALPDGSLTAFATEDGSLFASTDQGATWRQVAADLPSVQRVLLMP